MFIHTIPSLPKNKIAGKWLLVFCFALLSIFPVYRNFYYSNGLLTYERHRAVIEGRSEFYNPWQYRVLCPYAIEGMLWIYNHSIDKIYPVEQKLHFNIQSTSGTSEETDKFVTLMQTPGAMKYMILFVFFRWTLHLIIFLLLWRFWKHFIRNEWLIFFSIFFVTLAFGNAVTAADLSFNTYADIIFYLLTAIIILEKKNPLWLIPITILSAFNRETGLLIPGLYFISQADFSRFHLKNTGIKNIIWPTRQTWLLAILLYGIFAGIFIYLRSHFGYRPQQVWKVPAGLPMLKLNLLSAVGFKACMELIGTFALIPLIIVWKFRSFPYILRKWFIFLVPVWFAVHYISVVAYQTRLFMVPILLIFIPMMMWLIENNNQRQETSKYA